jgi:hypothetical protein
LQASPWALGKFAKCQSSNMHEVDGSDNI